ncbi:MAG TPA: HK97 gp10 family phage protein [Sphingobium sp.]|uniref:HK97 gp10 family phage protein n=1 Tax=Sphingobium sp. TaxID=1912891 RepID=UPI002ED128D8
MARRVKGGARIRQILRGMPSAFRQEMVDVLDKGGQDLVPQMQAKAPSRTGATREAIKYKVFPQSMKLNVGLIGLKKGRSNLFYARIQDLGRKAQVVTIRRGPLAGKPMNIRAMAAKHFVTGSFPELRETINSGLKGIFARALKRVSGGAGD